MTNKRFQRPINDYTGADELLYRDKYQQDSNSVPKIAISSTKVDGDFNYIVDAINTLDEDIKSVVHSGISNETINAEHISAKAVSEVKMADESVSSRVLQPGCVTNAKVADLSVTTPKIANNSVTKDKMSSDSVGTDELVDKSITRDKLADDAISDSVPVGAIAQFSVEPLPTGWILCNGSTVSKNTYPQLVRFLTGDDITLSAGIPNLNTDPEALAKYAIKAFSDTIELANFELAGLTQDVTNNTASIATKAGIKAEPIAELYANSDGTIYSSKNVVSITYVQAGVNDIVLDPSLNGKTQVAVGVGLSWNVIVASYGIRSDGKHRITTVKSNATANHPYYVRIYELDTE